MSFMAILGLSTLVVYIYMHGIFLWARYRQRLDVVDVAWGPGFLVLVLSTSLIRSQLNSIISVLTAIWGFRLAFHILQRQNHLSEDSRYVAMRSNWLWKPWLQAYIKVFLLQSTLIGVVGSPLVWSASYGTPFQNPISLIGASIWLVGLLWETIADWQLTQFKMDPKNKGRLMTNGLWSLSRHPNYFGEVVLWWGFYLIAVETGGWWTFIGPLILTVLILKVSGVPMLEEHLKHRPDFATYAEETPPFLPFLPSLFRRIK